MVRLSPTLLQPITRARRNSSASAFSAITKNYQWQSNRDRCFDTKNCHSHVQSSAQKNHLGGVFPRFASLRRLDTLSFGCTAPGQCSAFSTAPNQPITDPADEDIAKLKRTLQPEDIGMIDFLIAYKAKHENCHVPTGTTKSARYERERLGVPERVSDWMVKIRKQHRLSKTKTGKLGTALVARIIVLESIGFLWSCREAHWHRWFHEFRKQNGRNSIEDPHCNTNHLDSWVDHQRKAYRKGTLSKERESALRQINFDFDPNETRWWENYQNLCTYHKEHGDTMVPLVDDETGDPNYLGQWVARQRRFYHGNSLAEDRTLALNQLDFAWDPDAQAWDKYYHQLCDFYREHNHTRVPKRMGPLWNWVDRQRRSYRKRLKLVENENFEGGSLLTKENVQKLSTIGVFEWKDNDEYKDEDEHTENSPSENNNIRIQKLMDVTFELSIHDENWANHFDKLRAFHNRYNHFSIPTRNKDYKELNSWVRHTRYLYKAEKLPQNRIDLLESIGFAWTAETARWDRLYDELLSFHKKHGHIGVPSKSKELYRWKRRQQQALLTLSSASSSKEQNTTTSDDRRMRQLETLNKLFMEERKNPS